jgi:CheY-like chemotaxis protein
VNKSGRVLVVADSRNDSALLIGKLQKSSFEDHVTIIPDGGQAWEFLARQRADTKLIAIFLDLNLPTLGGLKLLCRIKSHPRLRDIPVIVMTSSNEPEKLAECRRLGYDGFVGKPVTYGSFTKAVADVFHQAPASVLSRTE